MVKLATPISTLFEDKEARAKIISLSDCLECREVSIESAFEGQALFHFESSIVACWSNREKEFIREALKLKRELKLISFHISVSCSKPVIKDNVFYCGGEAFSESQMLDNAAENISWLKTLINDRGIDIAVENNNYYPTEAYRRVTDVDFISQIVVDGQILFLFDIAHAKITAYNKKIPYGEYISGLPLDRLIQVHISEEDINDKGWAYDAHDLPDKPRFQEVKEIVRKFFPKYLTVEYYRDRNSLIQALEQYKELCDGYE